jgi:hypothetical protein
MPRQVIVAAAPNEAPAARPRRPVLDGARDESNSARAAGTGGKWNDHMTTVGRTLFVEAEESNHTHDAGPSTPQLWFSQMVCGLSGHEYMLHATERRLCLRCASCDHETPGWELDPR